MKGNKSKKCMLCLRHSNTVNGPGIGSPTSSSSVALMHGRCFQILSLPWEGVRNGSKPSNSHAYCTAGNTYLTHSLWHGTELAWPRMRLKRCVLTRFHHLALLCQLDLSLVSLLKNSKRTKEEVFWNYDLIKKKPLKILYSFSSIQAKVPEKFTYLFLLPQYWYNSVLETKHQGHRLSMTSV